METTDGVSTEKDLSPKENPSTESDLPQENELGRDEGRDVEEVPEDTVTPIAEPLLAEDEGQTFRSRWERIQIAFVDEPQASVEQADALVAELMQRLTTMFDEERGSLESRWEQGDDVSTEDLRITLQRYRSFFDRLLAA